MSDYKEYDPKTLRRLQNAELAVLEDVRALCEKENIAWFALGGCCIGAFRHGGFIPWDDDIDICMLRADYDRFLEAAAKDTAFQKKYKLIIPGKESTYPCMFAKVSKRGTKNMTAEFLEAGCDVGIHLDLFPFDYVPQDTALREKQRKKAWFCSKLSYIYHLKHPHLPVSGAVGAVFRAVCRILHTVFRFLPIRPTYFAEKYRQVCTRYNAEPSDTVTDFTYIRLEDSTLLVSDIFPLKSVPFEQTEIFVPHNYDKIMRQYYGDYMQLPPEEKRKNHAPEILDFGK